MRLQAPGPTVSDLLGQGAVGGAMGTRFLTQFWEKSIFSLFWGPGVVPDRFALKFYDDGLIFHNFSSKFILKKSLNFHQNFGCSPFKIKISRQTTRF